MPDRLSDLRRQRALLQAQLAAVDRELAAAALHPSSPPATTPEESTLPPEARDELAAYQQETGDVRKRVRRGCLIYFALAFALLILGLAVFRWSHAHS